MRRQERREDLAENMMSIDYRLTGDRPQRTYTIKIIHACTCREVDNEPR